MRTITLLGFLSVALVTNACTGVLIGPEELEGENGANRTEEPVVGGGLPPSLTPRMLDGGVVEGDPENTQVWPGQKKKTGHGSSPKVDASVPPVPKVDATVPPVPKVDATVPPVPKVDAYVPPVPKVDATVPPVPKVDAYVPPAPKPDAYVPIPKPDSGTVTPPPPTGGTVYYVRPSGGTSTQCTGKTNADYPGSGTGQACAFQHPFYALPPGGTALLKGGDTLLIAQGTYRIGHGAPGASSCSSAYPWDCLMPKIPSGPSKTSPTRILGEGWSTGCKSAPQLYGAERAWRIFDLRGTSNLELNCLDITDHSGCVDGHSGGLSCNRNSYPYGDWAGLGIEASDSKDVLLKNLDIHGLAHTGIRAGRLTDWTLENVRIAGNGWVGWDGDLQSTAGSSNSGTLLFRKVVIEWNGCAETYPGKAPAGCWGQSAGGYGDGLGTAATAGDWIFEDTQFLHNTSDGLDMLYHQNGGSITIRRVRSEGNAGNQIKVTGNALIENSILVGNCAYFQGKSFTYNVDNCRALGNTLEVAFQAGTKATLVNSTLYGQGDILIDTSVRNSTCNGSESFIVENNILLGDTDFFQSFEKTALFYNVDCTGMKLTQSYNLIWNVKNGTSTLGTGDLAQDPLLGPLTGDTYGMIPKSGSPAIDSGKAVGGLIPATDYNLLKRPLGNGVDRGACEVAP